MVEIYVDADACPVRDEIYRVAGRLGLVAHVVSNGSRPVRVPQTENLRQIVVGATPDAADDWIAEHVQRGDVTVTQDIPLARRCLAAGGRAISPRGHIWTDANIGEAMAGREMAQHLRELGGGSGPPPFGPADRSRFLQSLDRAVQASLRDAKLGRVPRPPVWPPE
jgi:uncharacterized protein YaiI (UPF0178 family)